MALGCPISTVLIASRMTPANLAVALERRSLSDGIASSYLFGYESLALPISAASAVDKRTSGYLLTFPGCERL